MSKNASETLLDVLEHWGVNTVFGLPGDGINGIMEALRKRQDKIRFIHVRHEEAAAFMACAYAKHTGRLGVCLATSGPGAIHLLNGLYDAKFDNVPVLAITGMQFHDLTNTHEQQDLEVDKAFLDVAAYNVRIMGPDHVEAAAHLACRKALANHAVSSITIPVDFQKKEVSAKSRSQRNIPHHSSDVLAYNSRVPSETALRQAAEVLNAGTKVAILAGRGALGASLELEQIAEKLGAPIVKALLGKAAVPDESPYTTGGIGLLGTAPSSEVFKSCDTLLIVGSRFPYMEFMPKPDQARGVQIDLFADYIGLRFPVEVGLVGDSKACLRALLPFLKRQENRTFLRTAQDNMRDWWKLMDKRASRTDMPLKPQVVTAAIDKCLTSDAIVNCDSGTISTWWARHIRARGTQKHTVSGNLASMACGLPYAIAAQIAFPQRQCVAIVGDGGFTMLMGEIATAVKYKLPIKIFIYKNNSLGQIKWEQMVFLGNPEFACDLDPNIDFVKFAEACGAAGFRVDDPNTCAENIRCAMDHPGPAVIECVVDPHEPPMPGQITTAQAFHFAESIARGTKDGVKILSDIAGTKIRELV